LTRRTLKPNPVTGNGRIRDDLTMGSAEQDYLLRVEPAHRDAKVVEARDAAITVCESVALQFPDLGQAGQAAMSANLMGQLGVFETLRPATAA